MVYFQAKSTNLGKFWRTLDWKMLVNFMVTFCNHLVHFVFIWYIYSGFGIMYKDENLATLSGTHESNSAGVPAFGYE
jgi:hypothetical protein